MLTAVLAVLAAGLLVYAALHDLAVRTVPNWLPLLLALIGCSLRLASHSFFAGLAVAAVTFGVLFVLWLLGGMGGGDVKLWAAAALLIPPSLWPQLGFFSRVILLGGVMALVYLALGLILPKPRASLSGSFVRRVLRVEAWRIGRRAPLPYACAIAGGTLATLLPLSFQR
ncbi:MAG TPA: prepilin peptidase [Acidocella sp.]|nr:prepilin peptidase [Acidocella sp.]